jgi:radical SAM superfamily enzyme YgiQ (UPF0313 family)
LVFSRSAAELPDLLVKTWGLSPGNWAGWQDIRAAPGPALDLVPNLRYLPLLTSVGCPLRCPSCASAQLFPHRQHRAPEGLLQEVESWSARGIRDAAFYDDALLHDGATHLRPVLEFLADRGAPLRLHAPNGVHVRELDPELCHLLKRAGFVTLRLGLETADPQLQARLGDKASWVQFLAALAHLREAGFGRENVGVYLLAGLPGQDPAGVEESIRSVAEAGAQPLVNEYSPIPGTSLWEEAVRSSPFDLAGEPLTHNNSFFACRRKDFTLQELGRLRALARSLRHTSVRGAC